MNKIPKRANKSIELLDKLVSQLHYFYGNADKKFRQHVLKDAIEIENTLKDLAINKKETFRRVAKKYERYYSKKQEAIDNTRINNRVANIRGDKKHRQDPKEN